MEESGSFSNNKTYFIPNADWSLLALLNSKAIWFDFCARTTAVRGGWREATAQHVEQLPIPPISGAAKLDMARLAEAAQRAAESRRTLEQALSRRLLDLCPPEREPRLSNALQEWWKIPDFAAFRSEVKKVFKADIPLGERSAWEDWITRDRVEIARLTAEIAQAEAKIDAIVYGLFNLDADEIALLESAVRL
jgi:hypothetical protein